MLENIGNYPIVFYFSPDKTSGPSPESPRRQVEPGEVATVTAESIAASSTNKYLLVQNEHAEEGHWRVQL